jgi:hypothetical protein
MLLVIVCCTVAAIVLRYLTTAPRKPSGTELADRSDRLGALPDGQSSLPKANLPSSQDKEATERVWGAGLTKLQAEDLLDWLEANGHVGELTFVAGKDYAVRESFKLT